MIEHIIRTERATLNYRLLAVVVVALWIYFRQEQEPVPLVPAVSLVVAYLAYVMLLGRIILPHLRTPYIVYGMALADTLALSGGLYLAGGPQGSLFFLFPLFIVYHAMFMGYRTALFSATIFSLAYAILNLITSGMGGIDPIIAVQIPFLFLVAILAGYLSTRRLEERREKEELQEFIRVHTHAQSLLETARTLVKSWEVAPLLQQIAAQLPSILGLPYGLAALWDGERRRLKSLTPNPALDKMGKKNWEKVAGGELGKATLQALGKGPAVAIKTPDGEAPLMPSWAGELGAGFLLIVPLRVRGETLGVAYAFDKEVRQSVAEKDLKLAESYGELAADALSHAQLYGGAQERIEQLAGELQSAVQRLDRLKEAHRKPQVIVGDLRLDGVKEQVFIKDRAINLSPTEFELLYVLAENVGQPVNQETLLRRVWSENYKGQGNVVDVSVHRLRRRLEADSSSQRIITVRGRGYMLLENPISAQQPSANKKQDREKPE